MADGQIAYSFDKASVMKMLKGLKYAVIPACIFAAINYIQTLQFESTIITWGVTYFVPVIVNAVKEWMKGAPVPA